MYTIGQVSEMFNLPVSTLRYYDKEGLFPFMQRASGIRQFSDTEIAALKLIECLKKSGLEIRDIKQFMEWCQEGSRTYELRKRLFERQKAAVEKEMKKMLERKVLSCNKKEIIPADEMEFRKVLSKTNIHTDFARLLDEYYRNDIKEYIFDRIQQKMKKLREYLDFNEEENE